MAIEIEAIKDLLLEKCCCSSCMEFYTAIYQRGLRKNDELAKSLYEALKVSHHNGGDRQSGCRACAALTAYEAAHPEVKETKQ
jgi:hypothetical protein